MSFALPGCAMNAILYTDTSSGPGANTRGSDSTRCRLGVALADAGGERLLPLIGLVLYVLFLAAAWLVLRLTSGSVPGILFGPIAAQGAMAVVVAISSRILLRAPRPVPAVAFRRVRSLPIVLIALGGFLFQATILAGYNSHSMASVLEVRPGMVQPIMWVVLLLTSVVGAPILEERFFRGLLQPLFSRHNVVVGLLVTAGLFGAAHGFETPFRVIPSLLQGLVLGGVMLLTGRLRAAIAVHALNNAFVVAAMLLIASGEPASAEGSGMAAWSLPLYGAVAALLLVLGFYRLMREPRVIGKVSIVA
jgi:membrane protease YdiL (CAAX protease family)